MTAEEIRTYCLQKPGAIETCPFGEEPACFRVCNKIFAQLFPSPARHWVTLKCEPMRAGFYRQQYPGVITRGYHCPPVQQPHNNTISYDHMADEALLEMIDHAYESVVSGLPKRSCAALEGDSCR